MTKPSTVVCNPIDPVPCVYIDMSKIVCMLEINLGTYLDTQVFWYVP